MLDALFPLTFIFLAAVASVFRFALGIFRNLGGICSE